MERYLGVKLIQAEPMNLGDYNKFRGWTIPEDEDPNREGYKVVYQDGYVSWSPKEIFEEAYRRLNNQSIIQVIEAASKLLKETEFGRKEGEHAYPLPNGEYKPYITVTDESVVFIGQGGPIKEVGVNGCQIDDIIEFAKDAVFNQHIPSRETSMIITKLDEALLWSMKRKLDREKRGVVV